MTTYLHEVTPRRALPAWLLRLLFTPAKEAPQTALQAAHDRATASAIEAARQMKRRT